MKNRLLWTEIDNLREIQRDQDHKILELGDTIKFLRNQDRKIIEFEDTLEVLRGSYSSLVDEISNLQVLSHQGSMVQEQDDWKERNISESSSAAQQRLASASNETLKNFEDNHERKKALRKMSRRASAFKYLHGKNDS
ncbi:hypothetical protein F8M41_005873 [Gigaspora margarita]|uniref:Uncharacterized protein n=1 Tax=Gigaspora margarita TaxID=4874 RepID=A0A8H4A5J2_GIGMA|nr:hypothetical protein F8M41_005873 [Gigaspora margarita]